MEPQEAASSRANLLTKGRSIFASVENWAIASALIAMVVLPLIEIVLRQFNTGVSGGAFILQHLVLFIAMIGGAIAAREGRLLALSTFASYLKGNWAHAARFFSNGVAAIVSTALTIGSWRYASHFFELAEKELFPGMPLWVAMLVMPLGFGLLAIRLIWASGGSWMWRLGAVALCVVSLWLAAYPFLEVEGVVWPLLALVLLATAAGTPLFVALGGVALVLTWGWGGYWEDERATLSIESLSLNLYTLINSPMLVTLPLFTLAGYFLAQGDSSKRLIRLVNAIFGGVRGGGAIVTVLVCAFFTTFTGASGVTILALGGLLMPILKSSGYSDRSSIGLLTGSSSLGVLFPPCLPLILYVVVATNTKLVSLSLEQIFLGGALPGFLLLGLTIVWGVLKEPKGHRPSKAFDPAEAARAAGGALAELALPVVALLALFSGYATPIEAASVSAFYAFLVYLVDAKFVRKAKVWKELPNMMAECGLLVGGVLLILGVAMGFTNYLVTEMIPDRLVEWAEATIDSKYVFLLALNIVLIAVGCLMDIFSAIIVVVPLIVPLGVAFGIDPVHLGIVFLANLQLGYLTPPIGMNLFLASYRFNKPIGEVAKASLPMLGLFAVGVLLITYVPALTTWLPNLFE